MSTRKYYVDNIRILCILLLIPFHAAMFYNSLEKDFYLHFSDSDIAGGFVWVTYLWWMSLLFILAGMSARYALNKRTPRQFVIERLVKLGRPAVFATLLVIPVQPYIADIFHNGYSGGYLAHYIEYYKLTDWNGYDGHYTPGQLWFMEYLLLIALVTLPVILYFNGGEKNYEIRNRAFNLERNEYE